ncbi:AraC family transcriptional regulator [Microvirga lotononidis]|uniref:DNA-binding domain-containing protein, AraC-type n=1 Tax=Microvirga lotononidis TaxID=864069 RepID=I4YXS3_9HYPH|nr:AraC family transcriptional regulator [Microvirga lotononidis]EIM28765.1 DNA-binding domain-containing protein, AraC-type [Microvirga lotononidis]WQO25501.1 AraC family transcriptional regulator [Microvirga lotononidis]
MQDNIEPAHEDPSKGRAEPIAAAPVAPPSSARGTIPPGYIHLGVSKEIAPVLREFGLDPNALIRASGLDPRLFEDSTNVVPIAALARLYTLSAAATRCPHLGLLVGRRATILSMDLVGRLMQHSDTVGAALDGLVSNLNVQDRAVVASLTKVDGMALLTFAVYSPQTESTEQITDASLAVAVNALRALCGSEWNPIEVLVPRTNPADPKSYRQHFRAPVRFNQESATLVFPAEDLTRAVAGADPLLRAVLEDRIRQLRTNAGAGFQDDIRRLLRTRMLGARSSAEDIAGLLAVHRRTLSRRLKGSGQGYRSMTNEIRFEIARQLLGDTEVPLAEIAAALGYSEASAFTRAFRRWSGQTPTAWRAGWAHGACLLDGAPFSALSGGVQCR